MIEFDITSFIGVNDYTFGESQDAVNKKNGQPIKVIIDNIMRQTEELRVGLKLIFIENSLTDIIIKKTERAVFNGIDLFNSPDAVDKLSRISRSTKNKKGTYILFHDLGICLGASWERKSQRGS